MGTQTRELNTVEYDPDNIVSLSNNQFTIEPGEWIITFSAPGYQVYDHKAKLVDVTNSNTVVATGTTEFGTGDSTTNRSFGTYEVVLTSATTYRIDHYTAQVAATYGLGVGGSNGGDNIFTTVDIEPMQSLKTVSTVSSGGSSGSGGTTSDSTLFVPTNQQVALIVDQKSSGTNGGSSVGRLAGS